MSGQLKRVSLAFLMAVGMVLIAGLAGEKEIIFPEITALLIGGWISPKQPWRTGKAKMVLMMTCSAMAGITIVRLPLPLFWKTALAFLFVACCLIFTRSTLVPMVSACILPVFLSTDTLIYPAAVFVMTGIIAGTRVLLERRGLVEKAVAADETPMLENALRWGKLLVLFMALAALPILSHNLYFVAPPLIVTFVEFAIPRTNTAERRRKVLPLMAAGALLGTASRLMLAEWLGLPLTAAAALTVLFLFGMMNKMGVWFPPVGAAAFLPLILPAAGLWLYPLEVAAGAFVLIHAARLVNVSPLAFFSRGASLEKEASAS